MQKVVFDTNVYIDWINAGKYEEILFAQGFVKYLSAVVLMELYAGAFSRRDQQIVDRLFRTFESTQRILTPTAGDYRESGRILQRLQQEKRYNLREAYSLTNDVLIVLSARNIGATVITQNEKDSQQSERSEPFSCS